ncbi:MAG: outer membrane beta-barrel protein [Flavisolibacter sp.]
MLRKITLSAMAFSAMNSAYSQDSAKTSPLLISGAADVYYKYDFGKSKLNNRTSFTNSHNSFELGMASLKFDYKAAKVEMVADLGFGKRAQEFSYNDQGILAGVKQLYLSYSPATWIKLTAGSWATHVGYEVVDAYANRNYSMSYMFTNGPFFHTGMKAEVNYKSSGFMIGLANPTDFKYVPDGYINKKFLIAQYSFSPGDFFKAYFNYVGGQNIDTTKSRQFDVVLTSKISSTFSLAYNGTVNHTKTYLGNKVYDEYKSWWGSAIYLNFDPTSHFGLTLREEYFSDKKGLKVYSGWAQGGNVVASTLSALFKTDNLTFIPEFRLDQASKEIFTNKNGSSTKSSANVLFAAIYNF